MSGTVLPMLNYHQIPKSKLPRPSPKSRRKASTSSKNKDKDNETDNGRKDKAEDKAGNETNKTDDAKAVAEDEEAGVAERSNDDDNDSKTHDDSNDATTTNNDEEGADDVKDRRRRVKSGGKRSRRRSKKQSSSSFLPPLSPRSMTVRMSKHQSYKMFRPSFAFGFTAAHQLAMTSTYQSHNQRGGLDFYTLARGTERSYSCSFLVNLDPDLLSLCSREDASTLDLARDALISHTRRIFKFITMKSGREINQVRFLIK